MICFAVKDAAAVAMANDAVALLATDEASATDSQDSHVVCVALKQIVHCAHDAMIHCSNVRSMAFIIGIAIVMQN